MEIKYYLESNIPQISPQQGKLNFYCFIYAIFFRKKILKEIMTQSIFIWESKFK